MATKTPTPAAARPAAAPSTAPQEPPEHPGNTQVATQAQNASGALALPADIMAELMQSAKDEAAKERPKISKISLKQGHLHYMDDLVKGNNLDVVILASVFRNVWYPGKYDPNNVVNPTCFALSTDEDGMVPHENVTEPANATCDGCPNAEWGSDPNSPSGRGKWCKQSRRLCIMPASSLESAKAVNESDLALLDVPVTSIGNWANLVNSLSAGSKLPFWAAVINLTTRPSKNQFELVFTPLHGIVEVDVLRAVMARREAALRIAMQPWDETVTVKELEEQKAAAARPGAKKKF